ncbi:MAG: type II toxin-antitoxin system RelE/ParE family toxin [Myxococcota bacterium]
MKPLPVVFRAAAARDVRNARAQYEETRPGLGETFAGRVEDAIAVVESNPELCQVVDPSRQIRRALTRQFSFAIYYMIEVERERVVILAVLPASMSSSRWRNRR